jgi:putative PIN family toxin of toxin-antitoxin system
MVDAKPCDEVCLERKRNNGARRSGCARSPQMFRAAQSRLCVALNCSGGKSVVHRTIGRLPFVTLVVCQMAQQDLLNDDISHIINDMRLVIDTNVIVSALRSSAGASAALLGQIDAGRATMLCSVALWLEYEDVLSRDTVRELVRLNAEEIAIVLKGLAALIEPVKTYFLWRPQLRDANDDMVLECAVNGQASAIVTFNRRDFEPSASKFDVDIIEPSEALRRILS